MSRVIGLLDIVPSRDGHHIDVALETDAGPVELRFETSLVSGLVYKLFGALGTAGKLDTESAQGATPAVGVSGYRAAPVHDGDVVLVGFQVENDYTIHYALGSQDALALSSQIKFAANRKPQ